VPRQVGGSELRRVPFAGLQSYYQSTMIVWLLLFKNISVRHESLLCCRTADRFVNAVNRLFDDTPLLISDLDKHSKVRRVFERAQLKMIDSLGSRDHSDVGASMPGAPLCEAGDLSKRARAGGIR
jgi:hypothetical protein